MTAHQTRGGGWPGGGGGDRFGAASCVGPLQPNFITFEKKSEEPVAITCRNGHVAPRQKSTGKCLECVREKKTRWRRRRGVPERNPKSVPDVLLDLTAIGRGPKGTPRRSRGRPKSTALKPVPDRWLKNVFTVYVVSAGPFVKVGLAENLKARIAQMQCSCPLRLTVAFTLRALTRVDARSIEQAAHKQLSDKHVQGEWFEATADDAIAAVRHAEVFS